LQETLPDADDAIEWVTAAAVAIVVRGDCPPAAALMFLLRRYTRTDRADLRDALEAGLARLVESAAAPGPVLESAGTLELFSEAAAMSDDERLRESALALIASLQGDWGQHDEVGDAAASVNACLAAAAQFNPPNLLQDSIDELERIVGGAYQPGAGLAHTLSGGRGVRGLLADHVRCASALLTAYAITGRLPYSMLAEEMMQFARRTLWDEERGGFRSGSGGGSAFEINSEAARVLCRLAALHDEEAYCGAAVIATGADYRADAARTVASQMPEYRRHGADSATYGLALDAIMQLQ
jgi:uncharacterized protein YyaL (SSP411 family)